MDFTFGRHSESRYYHAIKDRRSVGPLANYREGLECTKRNRDVVSSRNDYNLNVDGRQRIDTAELEPQRDSTRQRKLVSSDTISAGQAVTSTYTSTYTKSKTGAAFTGSAPSDPAKAGPLITLRTAFWNCCVRVTRVVYFRT